MGSIPVVGRSMRPILGAGVRVDVRPLRSAPRPGAILVFSASRGSNEGLVAHRLMRVVRNRGRERFVTKGDASPGYDRPIDPARVLGEVVRAHYRRISVRLDHPIARRLGWILASVAPHLHRIRRRMGSPS
jgi:hypothetical protein